jgi:hypothetical protein
MALEVDITPERHALPQRGVGSPDAAGGGQLYDAFIFVQ